MSPQQFNDMTSILVVGGDEWRLDSIVVVVLFHEHFFKGITVMMMGKRDPCISGELKMTR